MAEIVGGLFVFQRRLLYHPNTTPPVLADLVKLGVCEVTLETADGLALSSWYLPPRSGRPVIAYFHGNAGHIGYRSDRLLRFAPEGYGVLMVEYRGYGGNPGEPCETGLFADGEAAMAFLAAAGVGPDRVVLWGESLGTGVAVRMATEHPVAGLILEAPFTSVAAAAQRHYPYVPALYLVRDRFDSLSRIGRVAAPLLVLHGARDRIVPFSHGRKLYEAALAPKESWFVAEAGHEDLPSFGGLDAAISFIERRVGRTETEPVAARGNFG